MRILRSTAVIKGNQFPLFPLHAAPEKTRSVAPTQNPVSAFILVAAVKRVPIITDSCAYEIPETLEDPDPAVFCRSRSRVHHRERGQRCQRHRHVLAGGRTVWLQTAMDDDSSYPGTNRGTGNLRPHGRRHWQRP